MFACRWLLSGQLSGYVFLCLFVDVCFWVGSLVAWQVVGCFIGRWLFGFWLVVFVVWFFGWLFGLLCVV
jgi:hypothetical protein